MSSSDAELLDTLREVRDLLRPIARHFQAEYDDWLERERAEREEAAQAVVNGSQARRRAWLLADGTRTQREISKEARLDEGSTSKFFKALRDLGAIEGDRPTRVMEV